MASTVAQVYVPRVHVNQLETLQMNSCNLYRHQDNATISVNMFSVIL